MDLLAAGGAVPGWLVVAAAAVAAVLVFVLLVRAQSLRVPAILLTIIGLLVLGYAIVALSQQEAERQALRNQELNLTSRASALDGALAASGLACLESLEEMAPQCEAVVFARPQTVAAARTLLRARLMLLVDAQALMARAPSADTAAMMEVWRQPLARDPFGLVAVVLREDFSCPDGSCAAAHLLGADSAAVANGTKHRFETLYAAHVARWNGAPSTASTPIPIEAPIVAPATVEPAELEPVAPPAEAEAQPPEPQPAPTTAPTTTPPTTTPPTTPPAEPAMPDVPLPPPRPVIPRARPAAEAPRPAPAGAPALSVPAGSLQ